jgi:hypothetical protein
MIIRDEKENSFLFHLFIGGIIYNKGSLVLSRLKIWLFSVVNMNKDKYQKISNNGCFTALSFTLFLPINIFAILVSSTLESPFLPVLGLPLYWVGFPRPLRFWATIGQHVRRSPLIEEIRLSFFCRLKHLERACYINQWLETCYLR